MTNTPNSSVPTLYEWAGGIEALERLTETFYQRVATDPILSPVFAHMSAEHPRHVAAFIAEVFGGPPLYSERYGGSHAGMVAHHLNRHLTEEQRRRWVNLFSVTFGNCRSGEFRSQADRR